MSGRRRVLIPDELARRIEEAAARSRLSKEAWVRRALEAALAGLQGDDGDPVARLAELDDPIGDIEQVLREIDSGRR
jgi:hypothetical protein